MRIMGVMVAVALCLGAGPGCGDEPESVTKANRKKLDEIMAKNRKAFPGVPEITAKDLNKLIEKESVVLIDVRTPDEQKVSMIPGAITQKEYEENPQKYAEKTLVSYCTVGFRSGRFAQTMNRKGVNVLNFNGSVSEWCHAGFLLEDPKGKPTKKVHTHGKQWNYLPEGYEAVW